jgi:hypothetical protein
MGVGRKPLFWESTTTVLRADEHVKKLHPDWHSRRTRDAEHRVYVCEDKRGEHILLASKVTLLAEHLSKLACDRSEKISTTSLYNVLQNDGTGLNGGYAKHRWKCRAFPITEGVETFESARTSFQTATILGSKSCLQTIRT